jgi:meso-butanediol dehydrogenase/(S,S)-butanediol dehydrogenase/diacetyl reductase
VSNNCSAFFGIKCSYLSLSKSIKMKSASMARARFTDQVVFITGGSSGRGAATAELFAKEGAKLFITDLEERDIVAKLGSDNAVFQRCDVSSSEDCADAVRACVEHFGSLDVLFHNAEMNCNYCPVVDQDSEHFRKVTDTNMLSLFYLSRVAIPQMRKHGKGVIVATASTAGLHGYAGLAPYATAKAGLVNLIRTMALDHAREGIRINCVCPGYMLTPMTAFLREQESLHKSVVEKVPMGRGADPAEVGRVVLFLASDDASYVTGQGR